MMKRNDNDVMRMGKKIISTMVNNQINNCKSDLQCFRNSCQSDLPLYLIKPD